MRAVNNFYLSMSSGLGNLGSEIWGSFSNLEKGLHGYSAQAEAALARATGSADPTAVPADVYDESQQQQHTTPVRANGPSTPEVGGVELRSGDSAIVREVLDVGEDGLYEGRERSEERSAAGGGRMPGNMPQAEGEVS